MANYPPCIGEISSRHCVQLVGLEVKAASTVVRKDFSGLYALSEDTGPRFVRGFVLYAGEQSVAFGERYAALPVSALWRMLG